MANSKLPKCYSDGKGVCFACTSKGRCKCLDNTVFKNPDGTQRVCPFKKHPDKLKAELKQIKIRLENVYNLKYNEDTY